MTWVREHDRCYSRVVDGVRHALRYSESFFDPAKLQMQDERGWSFIVGQNVETKGHILVSERMIAWWAGAVDDPPTMQCDAYTKDWQHGHPPTKDGKVQTMFGWKDIV